LGANRDDTIRRLMGSFSCFASERANRAHQKNENS